MKTCSSVGASVAGSWVEFAPFPRSRGVDPDTARLAGYIRAWLAYRNHKMLRRAVIAARAVA